MERLITTCRHLWSRLTRPVFRCVTVLTEGVARVDAWLCASPVPRPCPVCAQDVGDAWHTPPYYTPVRRNGEGHGLQECPHCHHIWAVEEGEE